MPDFPGFPDKASVTPMPDIFFSDLLPHMEDLAELKATLLAVWLLRHKKGYPTYLLLSELRGVLSSYTKGEGATETADAEDPLLRGLEKAVARGTLLRLVAEQNGKREALFFLNTRQHRDAVEKIRSGELPLHGFSKVESRVALPPRPGVFQLYEENIGILTPIIAEELKEAETLYPGDWIVQAIREAARANRRSWRYISSILERWAKEGKGLGTTQRDSEKGEDPKRYLRGKYSHLIRH